VLLGPSRNGRVEWEDAKGRTLKEIQEAEPAAYDAEPATSRTRN
jgi:hypothetical protein